jgi:GxxExxY protein
MANIELLHRELTDVIIKCFFSVYNSLGYGFLEAAYRNALGVELGFHGLTVKREVPVELAYRGVSIGAYRIDLLVNNLVDEKQLGNYLKATSFEVGLLFNFGPDAKLQRVIHSNSRK